VAGSTTTSISPPSSPSEHVTRVPSSSRMR
jgi:hypothetical protein